MENLGEPPPQGSEWDLPAGQLMDQAVERPGGQITEAGKVDGDGVEPIGIGVVHEGVARYLVNLRTRQARGSASVSSRIAATPTLDIDQHSARDEIRIAGQVGVLTITGPGVCGVTASQAGNTNYAAAAPVTRTFQVAYRICVLSDQAQANKSGSTVPLKIALCTAAGGRLGSSAIVVHATGVDSGQANAPGDSQPGNNFRYTTTDGGSYQYNLKTDGLVAGTHRFTFTVAGDPTTHAISVVIR